jgi:hypothetical protein
MKMLSLILAEGISENKDDTINLWRAGLDEFRVPGFPATLTLRLFIRIELEPEEIQHLHRVSIRITHGDREVMPWQRTPMAISKRDRAGRARVNVMSTLAFQCDGPGEGVIESAFDEAALPLLRFRVLGQ